MEVLVVGDTRMGAANRASGHDYAEQVGAEACGTSLLSHLAARHRHSTPAEWASRIAAGLVSVDGRLGHSATVLLAGQTVVWHRPPWVEPDAPTAFAVLHRDEDVLAVAKPAGLPTLPGAGFLDNTLLARVRALDPGALPVHRLGRWTSGVVLFARHREAAACLARQLAERSVGKRYRALATGRPDRDEIEVTVPIGPVPHALLGSVHAASQRGRPAATRVSVVERRNDAFLCDVRIETGRPHQIRIHLAAAGHPLVGDPLYPLGGVPAPDTRAVPGDPGYLLHSAEISFRHPRTAEPSSVTCAPPPVLRGLVPGAPGEVR